MEGRSKRKGGEGAMARRKGKKRKKAIMTEGKQKK